MKTNKNLNNLCIWDNSGGTGFKIIANRHNFPAGRFLSPSIFTSFVCLRVCVCVTSRCGVCVVHAITNHTIWFNVRTLLWIQFGVWVSVCECAALGRNSITGKRIFSRADSFLFWQTRARCKRNGAAGRKVKKMLICQGTVSEFNRQRANARKREWNETWRWW